MQNLEEVKSVLLDDRSLDLKSFKDKYLSKNGILPALLAGIKEIPNKQKKEYGIQVNELKRIALEIVSSKELVSDSNLKSKIDISAPWDLNTPLEKRADYKRREGTTHPLTRELDRIIEIFSQLGFDSVESRQLDSDYYMFESLNIPKGHPARDIWDSFWTEEGLIPASQTSTMQNRIMKRYKNPPIRAIIPGRVFRNEATDDSHEHTFNQLEGVYIDKGITMGNMLGVVKLFLETYYQTELDIKVQPAYFPFTEPDAEFMMSCPFCKKTACSVCGYKGWIEIMGCGMIHPNVLREGGIDSNEYQGFAWGFGLDRLVLIKNSISNIRKLHSGDLNFLRSVK